VRPFRNLVFALLCVGALASCGNSHRPLPVPQGGSATRPSPARPNDSLLDLQALFSTGKDQAGVARPCRAVDAEGKEGRSEVIYQVLGRYTNDQLNVLYACMDGNLAGRLVVGEERRGPPGRRWRGKRGLGRANAALLPELAVWLALGDLFSSYGPEPEEAVHARGTGTLINLHRSMTKSYERASAESYLGSAMRNILEFVLVGQVRCAAQFKLFSEAAVPDTPSRRVETRWPGREGEAALLKKLGLLPAERGRLVWELRRQGTGDRERWTLRIHHASHFDAPGIHGRVIDQSMVCTGSGPLLVRELRTVGYRAARQDRLWRVEAWIADPGDQPREPTGGK